MNTEITGITYKIRTGKIFHRHQPHLFAARALANDVQSIRLPVSYKNQRHLPGYFWMSKMGSLVAYESRLEMTVLLQIDFNKAVRHVISQPFVLHYIAQKKVYRHTPDFLVIYKNGAAEVINVKPRRFINLEKNSRAFVACKDVAVEMGWAYSTRCEIDTTLVSNLKWLGGYRRPPVGFREYATKLSKGAIEPISVYDVVKLVGGLSAIVRPVLFHMLWIGMLEIDLYKRLTDKTIVNACSIGKNL